MTQLILILILVVDFELLARFGVFVGLTNRSFVLVGTLVIPIIFIIDGAGRRVLNGIWIFGGHDLSMLPWDRISLSANPYPGPAQNHTYERISNTSRDLSHKKDPKLFRIRGNIFKDTSYCSIARLLAYCCHNVTST